MKAKIFQILAVVSVLGLVAACGGGETCGDSAAGECAGDKIMTSCCPSGAESVEDLAACTYTFNDGTAFTGDEMADALSYCSAE